MFAWIYGYVYCVLRSWHLANHHWYTIISSFSRKFSLKNHSITLFLGLLVTIPDGATKFNKIDAQFFTSATEPYNLDIFSSAACMLDCLFCMMGIGFCCWLIPILLKRATENTEHDLKKIIFDIEQHDNITQRAKIRGEMVQSNFDDTSDYI